MVHSEVSFIIYSALSMPSYFLLYILWKLFQDHLDINIRHRQFVNPLQRNSLYCAARLANLEGILGLSVLSTILVKAGLMTLAAQE